MMSTRYTTNILPIKQLSEAERVAKNTPTVVKAGTTFII